MTHLSPHRFVMALDCPDAVELATFYSKLLGWELDAPGPEQDDHDNPEWVSVADSQVPDGGFSLGFQRVPDYVAPTWPTGPVPQQAHLDLYVDDIDASAKVATALGATRHNVQPSENQSFVVFLDPAGHPFCLCRA